MQCCPGSRCCLWFYSEDCFPVYIGDIDNCVILNEVDIRIGVSYDECLCRCIISDTVDTDIGKSLNFSDPGNTVVIFIKIKQSIGVDE